MVSFLDFVLGKRRIEISAFLLFDSRDIPIGSTKKNR